MNTKRRKRNIPAWTFAMVTAGLSLAYGLLVPMPADAQSNYSRPARVQLEIVASPGLPASMQHDWMQRLGKLGFSNVRVRTAGSSSPARRTVRLPDASMTRLADGSVEVTGVLTDRDQLVLPGLTVKRSEVNRIADWLTDLTKPAADPAAQRHAFGMTAEQLIRAHNALSTPLAISTAGKTAQTIIETIRQEIPLNVSASASKGLAEEFPMIDELQGVSHGTALAAALRPLGLVMVPSAVGGRVQFMVTDSTSAEEFWPIGWPLEKKAEEVAPDLFKFIPVDIKNARLMDALQAFGTRLKIPFLFDHNELARADIDIETVRITVPATKTFYKKALKRLFAEAKLKGELRVDEQGKAFYWVRPRLVKRK